MIFPPVLSRLAAGAVIASLWLAAGPSFEGPRDQGIGGTGVLGIVTGFGSIFVNGYEIDVDPSLTAPSDLGDGAPQPMLVGQVVRAIGTGAGLHLQAESVSIEHELIGPIKRVDQAAAKIKVLGQTVDVSKLADASQLQAGQWVAISGFRDAKGVVHASLAEPAPTGSVQIIADATLMPKFAQQGIREFGRSGRLVLRGSLTDGQVKIASLQPWSYFDQTQNLSRLSLQGYFTATAGAPLDLHGQNQRVDASSPTPAPTTGGNSGVNATTPAALDIVTAKNTGNANFVIVTLTPSANDANLGAPNPPNHHNSQGPDSGDRSRDPSNRLESPHSTTPSDPSSGGSPENRSLRDHSGD